MGLLDLDRGCSVLAFFLNIQKIGRLNGWIVDSH